MNETPQLVAHKITKPIQLLAAWLAGLAIVNASFLTAAGLVTTPAWLPALLAIAAVLNVPLFIASLFLLQTKFRPEMQEDTFYSKYLERKYSTTSAPTEPVDLEQQFTQLAEDIIAKVSATVPDKQQAVVGILRDSEIAQIAERFRSSRTLSELHLYPEDWALIHEMWRESEEFQTDFAALSAAGVVQVPDGVVRNARLTPLGTAVAERIASVNGLWNQREENRDRHDGDVAEQKEANKRMQRTR